MIPIEMTRKEWGTFWPQEPGSEKVKDGLRLTYVNGVGVWEYYGHPIVFRDE